MTQRCDVDMLEPFQENKNSSNTSGWSVRAHPVSYRCPAKEPVSAHPLCQTPGCSSAASANVVDRCSAGTGRTAVAA